MSRAPTQGSPSRSGATNIRTPRASIIEPGQQLQHPPLVLAQLAAAEGEGEDQHDRQQRQDVDEVVEHQVDVVAPRSTGRSGSSTRVKTSGKPPVHRSS